MQKKRGILSLKPFRFEKGGDLLNKRRFRDRILRIVLIFLITGFVLSALLIAGTGMYLSRRFASELPQDFFTMSSAGISPKLYCYRFSDRENRIGERQELSLGAVSEAESAHLDAVDLPKRLSDAFVAIEDKRFYTHHGVDWLRTAAAAVNTVFPSADRFGGSTITQQLIKNVTGENEITWQRKLREIFYALDLERRMDKSEILEWYLNIVPFSDGCIGIVSAADHYYSKSPSELTLAECASLAAIINSPSYYNPIRHPQNNLDRRNLILMQMAEQGMISAAERDDAMCAPLSVSVRAPSSENTVRSWYTDMVIEDVISDLMATYGWSRTAASQAFWNGGFQVDIAMDIEIQKTVEEYYRTALDMPRDANGISAQSACMVLDPKTGDILGVAGAVGQKNGDLMQNFATQTKRSPGSAIKPLTVYAPALELGRIDWSTVYDDTPVSFLENSAWPGNADGRYRGLTDIADAIARSTNTVAVRVLQDLGTETAFRWGKEYFGLQSLRKDDSADDCGLAALALGQLNYGVTLRELTAAYTVFADGGQYHGFRSYYRVTDRDGKIILANPDRSTSVISEGNAAIMTKLLQGVVQYGTSSGISLADHVECAGKTGTTTADGDRWFIGYTPELLCGIWCGFEYPQPLRERNLATGIWDRIMTALSDRQNGNVRFECPNTVIRVSYCRDSGALLSDACRNDPRGNREKTGYFLCGTEPKDFCQCHIFCDYDAVCGGVSHGNCDPSHLKKVGLIQVIRHFPIRIFVEDAQYVYYLPPETIQPNPSEQQPYFAASLTDACGISNSEKQYNRSCTEHWIPPDHSDWGYLRVRFSNSPEE